MSLAEFANADDADQLFRAAYPKLAGWVRRLVGDDDTAHEIASEVFVRLLSHWIQVENPQRRPLAPAGRHDQGGPVRGAGQAQGGAG
jgi:DNA-directed RNA polymerase specialized sigma24 family protein